MLKKIIVCNVEFAILSACMFSMKSSYWCKSDTYQKGLIFLQKNFQDYFVSLQKVSTFASAIERDTP